jgi:hypothetical protein
MIHVATKLARIKNSPKLDDNYLDMVNYAAFCAEFVHGQNISTNDAVEDDIAEMARKLAPTPKREEKTREKNNTPSAFVGDGIYTGVHS